jgi:hypothetical protein
MVSRKEGKEGSSFSEEKEAKRLSSACAVPRSCRTRRLNGQSFLVLFFKKERSSFPRLARI